MPKRVCMDAIALVTLAGTAIGLIAGCVQVADYLEKKRSTRLPPSEEKASGGARASASPASALPSGTVAFLFTDIEGGVSLWQARPDAMRRSVTRSDQLLRAQVGAHNGHVYQTVGDACHAVFASATDALEAALDARLALHAENWDGMDSLPVRMALHVGDAYEHGGDYFGASLGRVARLRDAAHGGQTLVSEPMRAVVAGSLPDGVHLVDRGRHLLKDLQKPEPVYELRSDALPEEFPAPRSLSSLPNNLPQQLTSFIGRDAQIAEVKRLLSSERLLTLTGAGGSGKTRLALQVAAETAETYPDGVWLVELAAVSDPSLVPQAVSSLLGVREEPGRALPEVLAEHLKDCRTLLILDSCEHLLPACASLCERLLRACPRVSVLVTSRESLGIAGEQSYRVPSLALPDMGPSPVPERLERMEQCESVRLFVERARLQGGDFVLSAGNVGSVAQVCRELDGIPFAIELAAARVGVLPVEQLATRLDDRFRLLTGGSRTALPRHQTLRALIDWSYDLLTEPEQALICRLSVFAGGWDLEAAEAVGEGDNGWDTLNLLGALVDKSLVVYEPGDGGAGGRVRYRLLETVRRYAGERLVERGEAGWARARHRDHFLGLAETSAPLLVGAEQGAWLARLECEHDNLRAALVQCRDEPEGAERELRLSGALWRFWATRGYLSEGRDRLTHALARDAGQSAARATAAFGAGLLAWLQCEYEAARALLEESLALCRAHNDLPGVAGALNTLGQIAAEEGNYSSAQSLVEESLALCRVTGNRRGEAVALMNLGNYASEQGRYADAGALYDESLALLRKLGDRAEIAKSLLNSGSAALEEDRFLFAQSVLREAMQVCEELGDRRGIAYARLCLGDCLLRQEEDALAETHLRLALSSCQDIGDRRGAAYAVHLFGRLALARGQMLPAVHLLGAADAVRTRIHAPASISEQAQADAALSRLRTELGDAVFGAAWKAAHDMTPDEAVELALNPPPDA